MSEMDRGAETRRSGASEALEGNGPATQNGGQPLQQPPDLRLQRTTITPYDLMIVVLLLIIVAAFFGTGWAASRGFVPNGDFAQAVILGLIPAILLYHFLDTRARVVKGWVTLTGAGAIAVIVWFTFLYWHERQTIRDLSDARDVIAQLELEKEARRPVTVFVPINDTTGTIKERSREFLFGVFLRGEVLTTRGENVLVVDNVPRSTMYRAFGFHWREGSSVGYLGTSNHRVEASSEGSASSELTFRNAIEMD